MDFKRGDKELVISLKGKIQTKSGFTLIHIRHTCQPKILKTCRFCIFSYKNGGKFGQKSGDQSNLIIE